MKEIAIGESFKKLYKDKSIYVDKTKEIYSLIKYKRVFFSRPRRFGKSMVLDTIATLFEKGVEPYFKDTWIYDNWQGYLLPVLRLNFLRYSNNNYQKFCNDFYNDLNDFIKLHYSSYQLDFGEPYQCLNNFLKYLNNTEQEIVILIDEYDCQLTANINNTQLYNEFQQSIRSLYAAMKGQESIKFLTITGVTRLKDVSIFSVGSDIKDVTYEHNISTITGFTKEEIKLFYKDYLKLTASIQNNITLDQVSDIEINNVLNRLAYEYNGYNFDKYGEKRVFSTWSVNNFFNEVYFNNKINYGDYWYDNGGVPSILKNYLNTHDLSVNEFTNDEIIVSYENFLNPTSLLTINQNVLMCQAGYLTLKNSINNGYDVQLCIPNNEIKGALGRLFCLKITSTNYRLRYEALDKLEKGSAEDIVKFFNDYLKTISYEKYPITSESILRGYLHIILLCYKVNVSVEVQNNKGRSDIQIDFNKRRIILELKYAQNEDEVQNKLTSAVEQIKKRDYGNDKSLNGELIRLAMVFNNKDRQFSKFLLI